MRPILLLIAAAAAMVSLGCPASDRHNDVLSPPAPWSEVKCTCSPCGTPCSNPIPPPPQSPPPIYPPPPPPPPPPSTPPPLPNPSPSQPSSPLCPPPPPSSPSSMWGPPGNLYPVDPRYRPSGGRRDCFVWLPFIAGCAGLVALWL